MNCKQRKILCLVGGTLVIGGILYRFLRARSNRQTKDDTDPVEFSAKSIAIEVEEASAVEPAQHAVPETAVQSDLQKHVFETIGAAVVLPPEWKVAEDISPVPNVAMISINNVNYAPQNTNEMPGSTPVLVLSVEDNSIEGLDLEEFKEKSKQTAIQQMFMMTNGMVPPKILFDSAEQNGEFEMVLEYALETAIFQIRVINFITMRDELAYVFQFMGNAEVFQKEIDRVREIIKNFQVVPIPSAGPASQAKISSTQHGYSVDVPVKWIIESQKVETIGDCSRVLAFTTASPVKTERVELLKHSAKGFDTAALEKIASLDKGKGVTVMTPEKQSKKSLSLQKYKSVVEHGMLLMEYKNLSGHQVLVLSIGKFALRITPLRVQTSIIKPEVLVGVLQSVSAHADTDAAVYINQKNGFSFPIKEGSRVVESRVGDNTVTFAPEGIRQEVLERMNAMQPNAQPEDPMPIFTVRCGDPSSDKDCERDLNGWMKRLQAEKSRGGVKMLDLGYEEINGMRCISFSQKEMQKTTPGKKDEHQAKIFVLVEGGITYMLRWETATEGWRKFTPHLNRLLSSFSIVSRA